MIDPREIGWLLDEIDDVEDRARNQAAAAFRLGRDHGAAHAVGQVGCPHCRKQWTAVYPVECKVLDCPRCDEPVPAPLAVDDEHDSH